MANNLSPRPIDFPQFYRLNPPLSVRQQNRRWVFAGMATGTILVATLVLAFLVRC